MQGENVRNFNFIFVMLICK